MRIGNRFQLVSLALVAVFVTCCTPSVDLPPVSDENSGNLSSSNESRAYEAVGVIITLLPDGKHVKIDHGTIDGFMEAMTMSFEVEDASMLENLSPGDSVTFGLTVTGFDIAISVMDRLPAGDE